MTPTLQTDDELALRELRSVGVLISDAESPHGIGYLFPGHGTHSPTMFDTYLHRSAAAGRIIEMADDVVRERHGFRLTDAVHGQARLSIDHPCVTQPAIYVAAIAGAVGLEVISPIPMAPHATFSPAFSTMILSTSGISFARNKPRVPYLDNGLQSLRS